MLNEHRIFFIHISSVIFGRPWRSSFFSCDITWDMSQNLGHYVHICHVKRARGVASADHISSLGLGCSTLRFPVRPVCFDPPVCTAEVWCNQTDKKVQGQIYASFHPVNNLPTYSWQLQAWKSWHKQAGCLQMLERVWIWNPLGCGLQRGYGILWPSLVAHWWQMLLDIQY